MSSVALAESGNDAPRSPVDRLFVAWQNPDTRTITPVGCLLRRAGATGAQYEFRYLRRAAAVPGFQAFVSFPDLHGVYHSAHLFPLFENRLMSRERADYGKYMHSLGLPADPDPFEVLVRTAGRRATDAIEVFPAPVVTDGLATGRFLVHGVRHVPHAQEAIDGLSIGEQLFVLADLQNRFDRRALLLRRTTNELVGWVPASLTAFLLRAVDVDEDGPLVTVEHVGDRSGPVHLRLLCRVSAPWPDAEPPLSGPEFEFA